MALVTLIHTLEYANVIHDLFTAVDDMIYNLKKAYNEWGLRKPYSSVEDVHHHFSPFMTPENVSRLALSLRLHDTVLIDPIFQEIDMITDIYQTIELRSMFTYVAKYLHPAFAKQREQLIEMRPFFYALKDPHLFALDEMFLLFTNQNVTQKFVQVASRLEVDLTSVTNYSYAKVLHESQFKMLMLSTIGCPNFDPVVANDLI